MPLVDLHAAHTEWVLAVLVGAGDEAVQRDGHVTGGLVHGSKDPSAGGDSSVIANRRYGVACVTA
jgi:hypothetical protein